MKHFKYSLVFALLYTVQSMALVAGPELQEHGTWMLELRSTFERGKVEPNENRASFQSAQIDIHQLSLTKRLNSASFGSDHFSKVEFKTFTAAQEEINGQLFYEKDQGEVLTFSYGLNFVHEADYFFGSYLSVTPLVDFNQDKFSVPRVDLWALGLQSALKVSEFFNFETKLHYGSGLQGKQNSYLALTNLLSLDGKPLFSWPIRIKFGPYAELDTNERFDDRYDQAFSSPGRRDRIRSMKFGSILGLESSFNESLFGSVTYVQKLGGYDAVATNAVSFSLGSSFE